MNLKRMAVMFTIMLITVLSASCFYVLSDEKDISNSITVSKTDYEKVYVGNGENAPYTETNGIHAGEKYYIRYTGALSGRTVVDLEDVNVEKNGKSLGGCGVTIKGDYPYIFGQKIESTYKMFSYISGKTNTEITRVFIPASIAITSDTNKDADKGIASNTFSGYENSSIEKDVIYHTGQLAKSDINERATGLKASQYDRTKKIDMNDYPNIITYVFLGDENIKRTNEYVGGSKSYGHVYNGEISNIYISAQVQEISCLFYNYELSLDGTENTMIKYLLLDEDGQWKNMAGFLQGQRQFIMTQNFIIPKTVQNFSFAFTSTNITFDLNKKYKFKIPDNDVSLSYMFYDCKYLKGVFIIPSKATVVSGMFYNAGKDATENIANYSTPIVMVYDEGCALIDSYTDNVYKMADGSIYDASGKVTKVYTSAFTSSQILIHEKESIVDNNSNQIVVESETNWISVTVNKKLVDEVVEETQSTSQSVENVESENKEEGEVEE